MESDQTAAAIAALLPELGTQMAAAARHVLAHPEDVAVFSMRELARRAGVPPVTMVRLAQRLGLAGYAELRRHYVNGVRAGRLLGPAANRNADAARGIAAAAARSTGALGFAAEFFAAEQEILHRSLAGLNEAALQQAATLLAQARRVQVVGRRTTYPAAFALAYALRKARPDVSLADDTAGAPETFLEDMAPGDVVVAISFAPYSRLTQSLADAAAQAGARVIGIGDAPTAPLAKLAGALFFVAPTTSRAFPESAVGALAMGNLLVALTVATLGAPAQQRIRANERRIVAAGEYLQARTAR
ncbi:MurR/RpiR family transcriptional regulator [Rhodovarius crocodyli]|uniref:MurR/RpiR family transcriptional regulator n=1 Tax=Rhodovarius crocodyli TaxID=1979269 RepID=A0A437M1R3_9PROT|nr:MurR/RpiR family transcriptional regulator [Rhodovarius crocodyli]RVT91483.1 MurR/RpiR family transcriptional regulator [Rhodovarius crocodyli]